MEGLDDAVKSSRTGITVQFVDYREDGRILERGFYAMWRGGRTGTYSTASRALEAAVVAMRVK